MTITTMMTMKLKIKRQNQKKVKKTEEIRKRVNKLWMKRNHQMMKMMKKMMKMFKPKNLSRVNRMLAYLTWKLKQRLMQMLKRMKSKKWLPPCVCAVCINSLLMSFAYILISFLLYQCRVQQFIHQQCSRSCSCWRLGWLNQPLPPHHAC